MSFLILAGLIVPFWILTDEQVSRAELGRSYRAAADIRVCSLLFWLSAAGR